VLRELKETESDEECGSDAERERKEEGEGDWSLCPCWRENKGAPRAQFVVGVCAQRKACRRRTRANGTRATPAASSFPTEQREVATPFFLISFHWGLCVCLMWEALSG